MFFQFWWLENYFTVKNLWIDNHLYFILSFSSDKHVLIVELENLWGFCWYWVYFLCFYSILALIRLKNLPQLIFIDILNFWQKIGVRIVFLLQPQIEKIATEPVLGLYLLVYWEILLLLGKKLRKIVQFVIRWNSFLV